MNSAQLFIGRLLVSLGCWCGLQAKAPAAATDEKVVVFTDPGGDDTFACVMVAKAAKAKQLDLIGVVTHYGCTTCDNATRHGWRLFRGLLPEVPVIVGSSTTGNLPPGMKPDSLPHYYDTDGMVSHGLCGIELPEPKGIPADLDGGIARVSEIVAANDNVHIVVLGPCTDVVTLLKNKAAAARIKRLTIMGGALGYGNSGPKFAAEFNVYLDVPAFAETLAWANANRVPVNLVPWDVPIHIWQDELPKIVANDETASYLKTFLGRYFAIHHGDGVPGDPIAKANTRGPVWYSTDPKVGLLLTRRELFLELPLSLSVCVDRSRPELYGVTFKAHQATKDAKCAGPFEVIYSIPANPEIAMQAVLEQVGLSIKH